MTMLTSSLLKATHLMQFAHPLMKQFAHPLVKRYFLSFALLSVEKEMRDIGYTTLN
ncbi:hypothetical protein Hdeb2414_s0016g00492141 [Helianthus debilis subsp. tardiflorus]